MASLLDIAPLIETVSVGGHDIEVFGLPDAGLSDLFARFPELRKVAVGGRIEIEQIIAMGGEVPCAIIGWGCVAPDAGETRSQMRELAHRAEKVANRLPLESRAELLAAVYRLTFPNGFAACAEKLMALVAMFSDGDAALPTAPDSKSRKSSSTSSNAGTTRTASGGARHAN